MKFWLISRTDGCDYDEFDSLLVRAESKEAALKMLWADCGRPYDTGHDCWDWDCHDVFRGFKPDGSNAKVEEVTLEGEAKLIIGSYNAG